MSRDPGRPGSAGSESETWTASGGQQDPDSASGVPGTPDFEGDTEDGAPPDASFPDESLRKERDDYKDALVRMQADFENYKKRVTKQQEELRDRAAEQLVEKLLPVLDTADLALAHGSGEDVKQLAASLLDALEKEGLQRIDNAGEPFDPSHHDAVAHEPSDDGGPQEVAEVMRAGYRWRGRVLRAAMVKVRG